MTLKENLEKLRYLKSNHTNCILYNTDSFLAILFCIASLYFIDTSTNS